MKSLLRVIIIWSMMCGSGCTRTSVPLSTPHQTSDGYPVTHIVSYPGETLALIAGWYTGSPTHWKAVQSSNPGMDPSEIRLGDVIMIPPSLVVERGSLPKDYIRDFYRRARLATRAIESGVSGKAINELPSSTPMPSNAPPSSDSSLDGFPLSPSPSGLSHDGFAVKNQSEESLENSRDDTVGEHANPLRVETQDELNEKEKVHRDELLEKFLGSSGE